MFGRNKVAILVAEFVGTAALTLAVISVRSSGIGYSLFVAIAAGITVGVMMLLVGAVSGGQFNPALTAGLWVNGLWSRRKVSTLATIIYGVAQFLGAYAAYWLYVYFVHQHLSSTAGHWDPRVMVAELVGTFVFCFGWMAARAQGLTGIRLAAATGGAFTVGVLIAALGSNGLINPAVAFGVRSFGWTTYVLGPALGGIVGVNLYSWLFAEDKVKFGLVLSGSSVVGATVAAPAPAKKRGAPRKKK